MQQFYDPSKAPEVALSGVIVPGAGDPYNSLVLPGAGRPDDAIGPLPQVNDSAITALFRGKARGFTPLRKTDFQQCLSFAYDVFGAGRLAIRAGAGVFHGVTGIAYSGWYPGARPPLVDTTSITNGSADNPASGIPNTTRFQLPSWRIQNNYSFEIQTLLPYKTQLDVSYIGNTGRQLSFSSPLNFLTPEQQEAHQGVDLRQYYPYGGLGSIDLAEPSRDVQLQFAPGRSSPLHGRPDVQRLLHSRQDRRLRQRGSRRRHPESARPPFREVRTRREPPPLRRDHAHVRTALVPLAKGNLSNVSMNDMNLGGFNTQLGNRAFGQINDIGSPATSSSEPNSSGKRPMLSSGRDTRVPPLHLSYRTANVTFGWLNTPACRMTIGTASPFGKPAGTTKLT